MALSPERKMSVKKDFDSAIATGAYAHAKQLQQLYPSLGKYFDLKWREHCDMLNREPDGDVEEDDRVA